jgi:hypothetical protein
LAAQTLPIILFFTSDVNFSSEFQDYIWEKFINSKNLEKRWFETLQNLSNGIFLYDIPTKKIIFKNAMVNKILGDFDDVKSENQHLVHPGE